jgi:predicted phosphoadenosine phosphosulfate sulfurtransferase
MSNGPQQHPHEVVIALYCPARRQDWHEECSSRLSFAKFTLQGPRHNVFIYRRHSNEELPLTLETWHELRSGHVWVYFDDNVSHCLLQRTRRIIHECLRATTKLSFLGHFPLPMSVLNGLMLSKPYWIAETPGLQWIQLQRRIVRKQYLYRVELEEGVEL